MIAACKEHTSRHDGFAEIEFDKLAFPLILIS
jgi:hypothetical protein